MAIDHRSPPFPSVRPPDEQRPVSSLISTIPAPSSQDG
jgi:bifunctional enzyme CysN/CysC